MLHVCTNAHSKLYSTHVHMNTQQTCIVIHTVYMHRHVCTNLHGTKRLTAHVHTLVQKHAELYCTHSTHVHMFTHRIHAQLLHNAHVHTCMHKCAQHKTALMYTCSLASYMHSYCTVHTQYTCTHMNAQICTT